MAHIPDLDSIPLALRERPQWVLWRYETREGDDKPTKMPYQARWPDRKASSQAPRTWADVATAIKAAEKYGFDGIGYVFSADDPFAGFDLDDIVEGDNNIAEWAALWLAELPTYVEISPSGKGVKGIAIGKLPGSGVNARSVELYDRGRYFTITGRRLHGFPKEPQPVNGALDRFYAYAQERKKQLDAEREQRRQRAYAEKALAAEVERVRGATEGTRNDTLNRAAYSLAGFVASGLLSEDEVAQALTDAAGGAGLGAAEIRNTLRSGMTAGKEQPRQVPPPRDAQAVSGAVVPASEAPAARPAEQRPPLAPITGDELLASNDPPPRVFVPSLIRAGLSFFIGQPGVGKTPALVQLAIALATGGLWLGAFRVPRVRVAYIGPEYDRGDIRSIVVASIGKDTILPDLLVFTVENFTPPASEEDAIAMIDDLVLKFGVEAIIIDLFTGFLPPEKYKPNAYRGDYREFLAYHRAALGRQIMICGAWHGTKRDTNPSTMYNGGQGFWGAAGGGRLVMYQDEEDQVRLYGQLRGNKAITYTMTESHANGRHFWAVVEGAEQEPAFNSDVHRAIWRVLRQHAGTDTPMAPSAIASVLKSDHPEVSAGINYVRRALSILAKRGIIRQAGGGYALPRDRDDHSDHDDCGVNDDRDDRDDRSDRSVDDDTF